MLNCYHSGEYGPPAPALRQTDLLALSSMANGFALKNSGELLLHATTGQT